MEGKKGGMEGWQEERNARKEGTWKKIEGKKEKKKEGKKGKKGGMERIE